MENYFLRWRVEEEEGKEPDYPAEKKKFGCFASSVSRAKRRNKTWDVKCKTCECEMREVVFCWKTAHCENSHLALARFDYYMCIKGRLFDETYHLCGPMITHCQNSGKVRLIINGLGVPFWQSSHDLCKRVARGMQGGLINIRRFPRVCNVFQECREARFGLDSRTS